MRIHLINPNTSRAMTDKIAVTAREVAGPDVAVVATCPAPGAGPAAVESHTDEAWAALVVAQQVAASEAAAGAPDAAPADGYVVACFGDPGLDAARELTTGPVVGIAEAAMHVATLSGRTFAVVTTLSRTLGRAHDLVRRYGYEAEAATIQDLYLAGRKDEAAAAVPAELLERSSLIGPEGYVRERIEAYREAGVTTLNVIPMDPDPVRLIGRVKEWLA